MKLRRTIVVAATALALLGATAGSASAAATDTVTCGTVSAQDPTDGWKVKLAGSSCFHSYGDWFSVTDENSDGYHVEVHWQTDYAREGVCKNSNGAGTKVTCDYDMAEGHKILFTVYVYKDSVSIMGGTQKRATT